MCLVQNLHGQTNTFPTTGNVGIGTISPTTVNSMDRFLEIKTSGASGLVLNDTRGTAFEIYNAGDVFNVRHGINSRLTIDENGRVGLGTPNPGSKLDVNGNASIDGAIFAHAFESNTIAPSGGSISFYGAYSSIRVGTDHSLNIDVYNSGTPLNALKVAQNGNISVNGNIGIGTTSPSERLSVNGNISTKKLIITQTGWSDYVFHKEYMLKSLSDIEAFIKKNKHLPDIPSAAEVEKNGISVGDNQALLLKKIEELTLYVIDLQRQNSKQQAQIDRLLKRKNR